MTEAEWRATTRYRDLIEAIKPRTERHTWLFACGCCRLIWHLLSEDCRRIAEQAEDLPSFASSMLVERNIDFVRMTRHDLAGGLQAATAVSNLVSGIRYPELHTLKGNKLDPEYMQARARDAEWTRATFIAGLAAIALAKTYSWEDARSAEAQLLKCIFSKAFLHISFNPEWRTSNVVSLAKSMYESRDFSPMPMMSDALQDAGCENADILDHCRGNGPHVRGCWVVDLILGKE